MLYVDLGCLPRLSGLFFMAAKRYASSLIRSEIMKTIALVAHDGMKTTLLAWIERHKTFFADKTLIATGTTGKLISETLAQPVQCMASGPLGGDQQIGALIAEQKIDWLIFFWDPLSSQPHDPDVKALIRLAVVWNIPVACNIATADFIIHSSLYRDGYARAVPDFTAHNNRMRHTHQP